MNMQLAIPIDVTPEEIARKRTLGEAISLCIDAPGLAPKAAMVALALDKAQWSRWESGQEGVVWPKLNALMDYAGNDVPLHWMAAQRNYDLRSLRKVESAIERENRELREMNGALMRALQGVRA